jgi:hypothetical protein
MVGKRANCEKASLQVEGSSVLGNWQWQDECQSMKTSSV